MGNRKGRSSQKTSHKRPALPRSSSPAASSRRGSSPAATSRRGSSPGSALPVSSENESEDARPAKRTRVTKRLTMQEKASQFTSSFDEDLTNEEIREKQVKSWTSKYYKHFKMPPEIDAREPDVTNDRARAVHDVLKAQSNVSSDGLLYRATGFPQQYVTRARHDDSTSNLKRHVDTCAAIEEAEAAGQLTIPMFAGGSAYSEPQLRLLLVQWCAVNARPMLIVEDEAFLKMMKMMHAHVAVPSAVTLARDIQRVILFSMDGPHRMSCQYLE
ncbi:hypothetical protein F5880DRAFT_1619480 [Lentinula raphanica]|nr:hypothetical protein F5880DRAFT_1619480 [Lentinula raphanica]